MTPPRRIIIAVAALVTLVTLASCAPTPAPVPRIPLGTDGLFDVPHARTTADVDACTVLTAAEQVELFGPAVEGFPPDPFSPHCEIGVGAGPAGLINLILDIDLADLAQPGPGTPTTISGYPAHVLTTDKPSCTVDVVLAPEPNEPGLSVVHNGDPSCDLPLRIAELVVPRLPLRNDEPA